MKLLLAAALVGLFSADARAKDAFKPCQPKCAPFKTIGDQLDFSRARAHVDGCIEETKIRWEVQNPKAKGVVDTTAPVQRAKRWVQNQRPRHARLADKPKEQTREADRIKDQAVSMACQGIDAAAAGAKDGLKAADAQKKAAADAFAPGTDLVEQGAAAVRERKAGGASRAAENCAAADGRWENGRCVH